MVGGVEVQGTAVSSTVIGMVLTSTANDVHGGAIPTMHGFRVSFLIATGAMAIGLLAALFLPEFAHLTAAPTHRHRRRDSLCRRPA